MDRVEADIELPAEVIRLTQQLEQQKLDDLHGRYETLRCENELLKHRLAKSEKDTHEFVAYFQKELESKDVRLQSLTAQVAQQQAARKTEHEATSLQHKEQLKALEAQLANSETSLTARVKSLEDELAKVESFREMKRTMEQKVESLELQLKQCDERLQAEATTNERKFLVEKSKMQKDFEERTAEIRRQAKQDVQNGLDADALHVIADNRRMAEELRFQQQTTEELHEGKQKSENEVKLLRRDLELARDKDAEYARQACHRKKETRRLEEKVEGLESELTAARRQFHADKLKVKKHLESALQEATLDASSVKQVLRLKNRELKQVRRLAQLVLDQRTDVEQFFLQALADVKQLIRDDRKARYRVDLAEYRAKLRDATLQPAHHAFPKIRALQAGKNMGVYDQHVDAPPPPPGSKVYLHDLTLEDREHVLRLLFAKINAVHANASVALDDLGRAPGDRTFVTTSAPEHDYPATVTTAS